MREEEREFTKSSFYHLLHFFWVRAARQAFDMASGLFSTFEFFLQFLGGDFIPYCMYYIVFFNNINII